MNVEKFNSIVSASVSKQCTEITESQQKLVQIDNTALLSKNQAQNLHLLIGSMFIEALLPLELK